MCGICGIINYNTSYEVTSGIINKMNMTMQHRGPDGAGTYINSPSLSRGQLLGPQVGFGHRRLKIIDLSEAGQQPMTNENRTIWIVFNGEIYNYKELRAELENKGHKFSSHTDTECAIHLYEDYREDCVKYIRGMFAFAIWDEKNKALFLARDRVGKKPLLYYHKDNKFCFASEFSAILASGLINRGINPESLDYYLTFGYVPAPLTIYREIFKLPPAHILILKDNKTVLKKYWELDYSKKIEISEPDAQKEVLRLLKEAIKIRLYSDVPLGAFLSGGIDSSTVVGLMSGLSDTKVKTFSIGFNEQDYNELSYARNIAKRFETEHHEFIVEPKALEILPLLVERYGEPYADSSCIPTYYVSKETRQYVTVALNGDGGDELFAGYDRYQAMLAAEYYQRLPWPTKEIINVFKNALPDSVNSKNIFRKIKRFIDGASLPLVQRYTRWVSVFDYKLKSDMYTENFANEIHSNSPIRFIESFLDRGHSLNFPDNLLLTDTYTYLPNDLLVKVDIAGMTNSLEGRSPFLDHKLMEFVAGLPARYKMRGFVKKYILKKAVDNLIPHQNIHRKKMGFGMPVGDWFRGGLKRLLYETLLSERSLNRGYFKPENIKNMVKQHSKRQTDYASQLWALLMFELWHQRFID